MFHFTCSLRVVPLLAIAACSLVNGVRGQEASGAPGSENELPVKNMVLVPCAEPDPPLQRLLIPAFADLQPGNAATSYYRAITLLPRDQKLQFGETQEKWLEVPLQEFPQDEARKWLTAYQSVLQETRTATFRESCDWNHRVRELQGIAPLAFLLPELQEARTIARVLRIQARLELAEGRFDEALATITMGYRLAENVAQSPILISGLVGIAIAQTMNACVLDWIESGGPNLYWALASLPNPLVDIRPALQQEMHLPLQVFPFLKDPEQAVHTPEQWRAIIGESMQRMASVSASSSTLSDDLAAQAMAMGLILAGYPAAKQQLIDSGMDAARVEAMPVGQVIAIQSARAYHKVYQESMKWTSACRTGSRTGRCVRPSRICRPRASLASQAACRVPFRSPRCCCPLSNRRHLPQFDCSGRSLPCRRSRRSARRRPAQVASFLRRWRSCSPLPFPWTR